MNEVFLLFLSLSLSGSIIASILFLLKPFLKNRFSKTWQYYIFLMVVLRFLIPFGSEISLVNIIFNQMESHTFVDNVAIADMFEIDYVPQSPPMEMPPKPEENAYTSDLLKNAGQMAINLLWFGWLAPAFILMLRKIIGYQRSVRSVKAGCVKIENAHLLDVYWDVYKAMKIKHSPALALNESVAAPMIAGAVRPVIVLPDLYLDDKELRYVFWHELTHYKRLDIIYKWLVQIMVCLHWYNPLVYRICREINRNCELSCDEAVIMRLDETEKYDYGDMLLETIKLNKKSSLPVVSLTLNEDTRLIKERLDAIMKYRKKTKITVFVSSILAVFLLCGATFVGAYSAVKPITPTLDSTPISAAVISDAKNSLLVSQNEQTVVYEDVEMYHYAVTDGHPYIYDIKTNNTSKNIVGCQRGMLAYDKDGQPLKIDWYTLDQSLDLTFYYLYDWNSIKILSGETDDSFGGWSLNYWGEDLAVAEIAYVLYCDKEITFEDGTVWENLDFENWLKTYEGKTINLEVLKNYYPYVHKIIF